MVIPYLSQQTSTCSKSATKTLEIKEDKTNEKIFKKQPLAVFFKKNILKYLRKFIEKHFYQSLCFDKVAWGLQRY